MSKMLSMRPFNCERRMQETGKGPSKGFRHATGIYVKEKLKISTIKIKEPFCTKVWLKNAVNDVNTRTW